MASIIRQIRRFSIHQSCVSSWARSCLVPSSKVPRMDLKWFSTTNTPEEFKIYSVQEVKETINKVMGTHTDWGSDKITDKVKKNISQVPKSQDELTPRTPGESYCQVLIPLGSCEIMRNKYVTFKKVIRFGRLLEAFDAMAVLICYKHSLGQALEMEQKSPLFFVTALVDRIHIDPKKAIDPTKDIYLDGNVTWVGKSSLECTMHILQVRDKSKHKLITAHYLFVAMNPETRKAAFVNPLDPETEEEKRLFKMGEDQKVRRMAEGQKSLLKVPPSEPERLIIHEMFLSMVDLDAGTLKPKRNVPNSVWMKDTILKTLQLCQPEERNMYNKMFGGFLMRQAFELAWINASVYSKSIYPMCKTVDDVVFRLPVEIGSLLFLSSQIVFVNGSDVQVKVHAEVVNPLTGEHKVTNNFHFTFDTGVSPLPQILPRSYAEAMMYLDGRRHYYES